MTWIITAFLVGVLVGAAACWLWAMRAMHPHDEMSEVERYAAQNAPERPTSADRDAGKGQVPAGAGNALSALERYAQRQRGIE